MTNSHVAVSETYETDKTDAVSNNEFLSALFGSSSAEVKPVIVSFAGNPQNVSGNSWWGPAWNGQECPSEHNNYFTLSVFRPDEAGNYRRKREQFYSLHAVMLDDVGTKAEKREGLTLPPSWMIETSPGNYQAGYIFDAPVKDQKIAKNLMDAIVAAGLCDPGANGPVARMARLPVASNGKHTPAFPCRLVEWQPTLRYSVDDLIKGLSLDLEQGGEKPSKQKGISLVGDEEIFVPRPEENPVIKVLKERRLYKVPLGDGKHDITCPWVSEHTDSVDSGTVYFEPNEGYPVGGFKCQHGHCAHRHVRDFLEYLSIEPGTARMKPVIRCIPGDLHRIIDRAEQELARGGRYYQRGGMIITIITDPGTVETSVREVNQNSLKIALARIIEWQRMDGRSKEWTRIDPPNKVAAVLCDATGYNYLPVLNGIAHQPYLRPDGTLATIAGHDSETGMYGVFDPHQYKILENPTKEDAKKALDFINSLLDEFPFASENDRAAALSAMLTAAIRPSLDLAPMYHVRAPEKGSGKSFLCQIIGAFASPRRNAPATFPHDDEECRKLLLSEFLRAPAVIEFDNLTTDLIPHKSLCIALTSTALSDRILGASKTTTVSTRTLLLSSGNNVGPVGDMTRRTIIINLSPECEVPASREFKNPLVLSNLHQNRADYVSAALTIIRAWLCAGKPMTKCRSIASYGGWSDLCVQPLLWMGQSDPTASLFDFMNIDPEREVLGRFLHAWHGCFGNAPRMIRNAVSKAEEYGNEELQEVLLDIAGERGNVNRRSLGRWVKRNVSRIVDGLRIVPVSGSRSAAVYRVESVSSVSSVSKKQDENVSDRSEEGEEIPFDDV